MLQYPTPSKNHARNTLKRVIGISKHFHHSNILKAFVVPIVDDVVKYNTMRLYRSIFKQTPHKRLAICLPIPLHPQWSHHQGYSSRHDSRSRCRPSGPNHSQITIYKNGMWHCWIRGLIGEVSWVPTPQWWLQQAPVWGTYPCHTVNEVLLIAGPHSVIYIPYLCYIHYLW